MTVTMGMGRRRKGREVGRKICDATTTHGGEGIGTGRGIIDAWVEAGADEMTG